MKRLLAILLAMAMLFSVTALAEENTEISGAASGEMGTPPDGTPPENPDGNMAPPDGMGGQPPEKPDGAPGGGFGGGTPPGGGTSDFDYTAATEITEAAEQSDQTYASETVDESALIVNTADAVSITNPTVTKTGDSNGGDNCNFYGLNAGLLVMGGTRRPLPAAQWKPLPPVQTVSFPMAGTAGATARKAMARRL